MDEMKSLLEKFKVRHNHYKSMIKDRKENCRNCGANELKENKCAYCGTTIEIIDTDKFKKGGSVSKAQEEYSRYKRRIIKRS